MHRGFRLAALAAFALALLIPSGCGDDISTRSVVTVVSVNNNMPLQSDVRDAGSDPLDPSDDTIYDDVVEVTMSNYPHDRALDLKPGFPFGDVIFTSYDVTFVPVSDGSPVPSGFTGSMYLKVPNAQPDPYNYIPPTAYILLVPAKLKVESPLVDLPDPGSSLYQINTTAQITFHGEETESEDPVTVRGTVMVSFGDYADQEEEE
jgi:hypothetical protein